MDIRLTHKGLWDRTLEIFGSEGKAERWLHTRLWELNDRTPEEVIEEGDSESVADVLGRIEYGVFV